MALDNKGTNNNLRTSLMPVGYSRPAPVTVADTHYPRTLELSVLKATVEDADPAVTMANIISNGTIGITKQISDIVAADYLASATVDFYTDWTGLKSNNSTVNKSGDFLKSVATSYICKVTYYVKAT